eukprot:CAMPEP_0173322632 /NCGR_PEP_ID=MMETSP1143-20121109/30067_1 /TAXON_ID=483371 /ORGANISM="non described non described, Strain CCMP2298" /LENGTH=81 /DNA_ID=CAMNT_0014266503 /DNA_START=252 /DNA_END=497 /DNA_ORIENTATION=-
MEAPQQAQHLQQVGVVPLHTEQTRPPHRQYHQHGTAAVGAHAEHLQLQLRHVPCSEATVALALAAFAHSHATAALPLPPPL